MIITKKQKININWFIQKPKAFSVITSSILFLLLAVLITMRYQILVDNEHHEMISASNIIKQNIEQSLNNATTTAITLALTINDNGIPENFEQVSSDLLKNNKYISTVELLPNGIIKYVSPLIGNESLIGYNVLATPEQKIEAEKTIKKKSMFFAGPMNLKQGGKGIVGRLPVFKKDKFWGFASIVIPFEKFEKFVGFNQFNNNKFHFLLSKTDSKNETFFNKYKDEIRKNHFVKTTINQGNWNLFLVNSEIKTLWVSLLPLALLVFLFSILIGYLLFTFLKKPSELIDLTIKQAIAISTNEMKFKKLFDEAPIGIAQVDSKSGNFVKINHQFCECVGYSENELKQTGFQKITHPDDLEKDLMNVNRIIDGEIDSYSIQKRYIHKNGNYVWVNLTVSPLWKHGENQTDFIAIVEDITAKKEAKKDLKKSYKLVTEQNQRLLNFSYIVSHNLRSHTGNIESISTLLDDCHDESERSELLQLLKKVSDSLNETMSNLNDVIKIQSDKNINTEKLNLHNYINNTLTILSESINQKKVVIKNSVKKSAVVNHSPAYLESILLNFISNAIKYSHPEREPVVAISFNKNNELIISDNGLGIDLEKHGESLFGMYKTFHSNSDARGIGLFITKNQIEALGGSVFVESEVNKGTSFTIAFND